MRSNKEINEMIVWYESFLRENVKAVAGMECELEEAVRLSPIDTYNNVALLVAFMRVYGGNYSVEDVEDYVAAALSGCGKTKQYAKVFFDRVKRDDSASVVTVYELEKYGDQALLDALMVACQEIMELGVEPPAAIVCTP